MGIFLIFRGEIKTCSKPPPRWLFWWMLMFNRFTPEMFKDSIHTVFLFIANTTHLWGTSYAHVKKHVASMSWTCLRCLEHVPNIVSQMVIYHGRIRKTSPKTTPRFPWFKSAFQRTKSTDQNSNLDVPLEVRING